MHGGYFDLNKHVFQEMVVLHQCSDILEFHSVFLSDKLFSGCQITCQNFILKEVKDVLWGEKGFMNKINSLQDTHCIYICISSL